MDAYGGAAGFEPRKMFVGGLSWETSAEGLKSYFSEYGPVADSVIMVDGTSKNPRGFGFVTFEDDSSVLKVLTENKPHIIDTKKVDPKRATAKSTSDSQQNYGGQSYGGGQNYGGQALSGPALSGPGQGGPGQGGPGQGGPGQGGQKGTKKIFVGGLAANTTEEDVREYFEHYGPINEVDLKFDKVTTRMRGFGFVEFESEDIVDKVIQTHYHQINGKTVETKKAEPRNNKPGGSSNSQKPVSAYTSQYEGYGYTPAQQQQYYQTQQQQQQQQQAQAQQQYGYGNYAHQYGGYGMAAYAGSRYPTNQVASPANQQLSSYSQDASPYSARGYTATESTYNGGGQSSFSGYGSYPTDTQAAATTSYGHVGQAETQQRSYF